MNRLVKITKIEIKLYLRNFFSIFFAIVFPLLMLVLFGSIYGNEPTEFFNGYGSVDVSVPAYICMIIAVNGLMSLPLTIAEYREKKILKRFMATPINPKDILISQVIVAFIMNILSMFVMIIVGVVVFDLHFMGRLLPTMVAFLIITMSIFSIGIVIAGVSPNGKTANVLSYIVYFPMLFLSGATMPLEMMPDNVVKVANILPLTYGVRLLKGIWLGGQLSSYLNDIMVLAGVFIVCSILAVMAFKWE